MTTQSSRFSVLFNPPAHSLPTLAGSLSKSNLRSAFLKRQLVIENKISMDNPKLALEALVHSASQDFF
jgi:hypothetical protein